MQSEFWHTINGLDLLLITFGAMALAWGRQQRRRATMYRRVLFSIMGPRCDEQLDRLAADVESAAVREATRIIRGA